MIWIGGATFCSMVPEVFSNFDDMAFDVPNIYGVLFKPPGCSQALCRFLVVLGVEMALRAPFQYDEDKGYHHHNNA